MITEVSRLLKGRNYCILHGWQGLPEDILSDLDIVIAPDDLAKLEEILVSADQVLLVNLLQHESTGYYFVLAISREGRSVRFLPLDAATDYRRDGKVWFRAEALLAERQRWNGFWVASPKVEFAYLLVKKILKGTFPPQSARRLQMLVSMLGGVSDVIAEDLLGRKWATRMMTWIRNGEWQQVDVHVLALQRVLKWQNFRRNPLNTLRYWFAEIPRVWRRWRYPTGLWIAVLAPDGAGKSTLIKNLQQELQGAFRRTEVFHLMPRLLQRKNAYASVNAPHSEPRRGWLVSLLKLVYFGVSYMIGYWMKIRPALVRSTLVLFDRYYDDMLVDPRRYRYGGPMWAAAWLRRFIPRPHLWLILDAPAEEVYQRKQEVPLKELRCQRKAYRHLAFGLPNVALLDASLPTEDVTRQAKDAILACLRRRYLKRRRIWFKNAADGGLMWLRQILEGNLSDSGPKKFFYVPLPDGRGYLLPAASREAAKQGLSLYRPQKLRARWLKKSLQLGLETGIARYFLGTVSMNLDALVGFLREIFGREDITVAVSMGTPGPHRKPVVQVLTSNGEIILGYVKIGWNEESKMLVRHEAETLLRLEEKDLPFVTPRIYFADVWRERFLCVQSAPLPNTGVAPLQWGKPYRQVLKGLASLGVVRRPLVKSAFWQQMAQRVARMRQGYWKTLLLAEMTEIQEKWQRKEIPFHLAHGDLAPWNALLVEDGRLYLYDWEYAGEMPVGYDVFHYWVQTLRLVHGKTHAEIVAAVRYMDLETNAILGMRVEDKIGLFRLYLLARLSQTADIEGAADAQLIGGLLQETEIAL